MTLPRPTDEQIGYTLALTHHLARVDPGVYHALARITAAMHQLHFNRLQGDYDNDLRPTSTDDTVSSTREPDDQMFERAFNPLAETERARREHENAATDLSKLATKLEVTLGWAAPTKGRHDRRGRLMVESIGQDGVRRIG